MWRGFFRIASRACPAIAATRLALASPSWNEKEPISKDSESPSTSMNMQEVAKHNSADDAWVVIDGQIYDVTSFIESHPGGGGVLRKHLGRDVSHIFRHIHSPFAANLLPGLHVGQVSEYSAPPAFTPIADEEKTQLQIKTSSRRRRICIVGAGICGTALSSLLASDNEVVVVDSAPLIGGTALRSTAILFVGPVIETDAKSKVSLNDWSGHVSFDMIKNLKDVEFVERGTLGVFSDEEAFERAKPKFAPGGRLHGSGQEIVSRERMLEIEPQLSPDLVGATWQPKGLRIPLCLEFNRV